MDLVRGLLWITGTLMDLVREHLWITGTLMDTALGHLWIQHGDTYASISGTLMDAARLLHSYDKLQNKTIWYCCNNIAFGEAFRLALHHRPIKILSK